MAGGRGLGMSGFCENWTLNDVHPVVHPPGQEESNLLVLGIVRLREFTQIEFQEVLFGQTLRQAPFERFRVDVVPLLNLGQDIAALGVTRGDRLERILNGVNLGEAKAAGPTFSFVKISVPTG